jgi:rhodanese-related sulfurtransferase
MGRSTITNGVWRHLPGDVANAARRAPRAGQPKFRRLDVVGLDRSAIEEVSVLDTWARLKTDPASILIDVRTKAEWAFVGVVDLSSLGKQPVLIEWQSFPDNRVHDDFTQRLIEALGQNGVDQGTQLLFLCRSGGRSAMAARTMQSAGFSRCCNVTEGFEGGLNPARHRGQVQGWKAKGLPWVQG